MAASHLAYLFKKVIAKKASAEEKSALQALLLDPENEDAFKALLDKAFIEAENDVKMDETSAAQILEIIRSLNKKTSPAKVISLKHKRLRWVAAAAIAVIVTATGWWLASAYSIREQPNWAKATETRNITAPVNARATLTLSSGKKILLDNVGAGKLTAEEGVQIAKDAKGRIVYSGNNQIEVFNTLTLPRGSRPFQLVLADGSIAWLNAASSITYPTAFTGQNRRVEMEGEVYFEVAHDKLKPFIVQTGTTRVEVLGTHFNVKSFTDESSTDITLLEGSVRVERKDRENTEVLLQPGQQAIVSDGIRLVKDADIESAMAWKNGYFSLKGADLYSVMRQISRWYDIDVVYQGKITNRKFIGAISRDISLNDLLQSLKEYGIEGRLEQQKLLLQMKE